MIDQRTKEANRNEARILSGETRSGRATFDRHRPAVVRLAGPVAVLCGAGLMMTHCGRQEAGPMTGFSDPEEWETYKARFVTAEGRVLDDANGDITHSEGVGYALLLAVHYGDAEVFGRIWKWSSQNLRVRDDGLFAWRWQPSANEGAGGVDDFNNATDGDILIAWALLRAAERWDDGEYRREAMGMIVRIREGFGRPNPNGVLLLPGADGFEHGDGVLTVNPSYWVFPAFEKFAEADDGGPPDFWADLIASGSGLIRKGRFGAAGLPADWLKIGPAGEISLPGEADPFPAEFGYNAVRVPLYLAWAGLGQPELHQDFSRIPDRCVLEDGRPAATWNLRSNSPGSDPAMSGALAIFEMSRSFGRGEEPDPDRFPDLDENDAYYSASLLLLTKMALDERDL